MLLGNQPLVGSQALVGLREEMVLRRILEERRSNVVVSDQQGSNAVAVAVAKRGLGDIDARRMSYAVHVVHIEGQLSGLKLADHLGPEECCSVSCSHTPS
jgi:hypothetical protein